MGNICNFKGFRIAVTIDNTPIFAPKLKPVFFGMFLIEKQCKPLILPDS